MDAKHRIVKVLSWIVIGAVWLAGCSLFESSNNDSLKDTQVALGIQQTSLAQTQEGGAAATIAAQETIIAAQAAGGGGAATPDMAATQVAFSVQQTVAAAAGGGSGGGAPTSDLVATQVALSVQQTNAASGALPAGQPTATQGYVAGPGFSNFTDNFLDPSSGWPVQTGGQNGWWYANQHYYISVGSINTQAVVTPGYSLGDGYIMASGQVTQDQPHAYYGVVCRYQDADNYYFFEIGYDGDYRVGMRLNGQWMQLNSSAPKTSGAIRYGYNQVAGHCYGNQLSLYVNDTLVDTVYDNTFAYGQIGLCASTGDFPGMTVEYDFMIAEE